MTHTDETASPGAARVVVIADDSDYARHMAARVHKRLGLIGVLSRTRPGAEAPTKSAHAVMIAAPATPAAIRRAGAIAALKALLKVRSRADRLEARVSAIERALAHDARRHFLAIAGPTPDWPDGVDVLETGDINSQAARAWCAGKAPDLLLVAGAPILKEGLLAIPRLGALNAHGSVLPRYRGTRATFWQVHNNDFEDVGVSIHFVARGVDTGDIVFQQRVARVANADPARMAADNQLAHLDALPEAAAAVLAGRAARLAQTADGGRVYRWKDITLEARATVLRTLGYLD